MTARNPAPTRDNFVPDCGDLRHPTETEPACNSGFGTPWTLCREALALTPLAVIAAYPVRPSGHPCESPAPGEVESHPLGRGHSCRYVFRSVIEPPSRENGNDCGTVRTARSPRGRGSPALALRGAPPAGYDAGNAMILASHVEVDLHDATRLLERGCPPETAMKIVLSRARFTRSRDDSPLLGGFHPPRPAGRLRPCTQAANKGKHQ